MTRIAASMLVAACLPSVAAQPLLLKSRRAGAELAKHAEEQVAEEQLAEEQVKERSWNPRRVHRIVQFGREPGSAEVARVRAAGARVVEYVPFQALLVVSTPEWDPRTVGAVRWEAVGWSDKWSMDLEPQEKMPAAGGLVVGVLTGGNRSYLIEFFPDVGVAEARGIASQEGLVIRERPDLRPQHLLVEGTRAQARRLTGWDEVAYVFPASEALKQGRAVQACAGAWTLAGGIGQYVERVGEGWDGAGKSGVDLSYRILNISTKVAAEAGQAEIARALAEWSRYVKVGFSAGKAANGGKQLDILFANGEHGDPYPFDGTGKVLAHTFYPAPPNPEPLAGDLHLDDAEPWRVGTDIDLYSVVLHELGHALGLGHSDKPGSVMYAYYQKFDRLTQEDIDAIRGIYAERTEEEPVDPGAGPEPAPGPDDPSPEDPSPEDPSPEDPGTPEPKPTEDKSAPVLRISSPAMSSSVASGPTVTVRGTASDNVGVDRITWKLRSAEGEIANGASWTAEIPVIVGINTIVIRAWDAAGNSSWRSLSVTRR